MAACQGAGASALPLSPSLAGSRPCAYSVPCVLGNWKNELNKVKTTVPPAGLGRQEPRGFLGIRCLAAGCREDNPDRSSSFAIAQSQGRGLVGVGQRPGERQAVLPVRFPSGASALGAQRPVLVPRCAWTADLRAARGVEGVGVRVLMCHHTQCSSQRGWQAGHRPRGRDTSGAGTPHLLLALASSGPAQPLLPALGGHGARASSHGCECAVSTRPPSGSAWSAGPPTVAPTHLPGALGPSEALLAACRPRRSPFGIVPVE